MHVQSLVIGALHGSSYYFLSGAGLGEGREGTVLQAIQGQERTQHAPGTSWVSIPLPGEALPSFRKEGSRERASTTAQSHTAAAAEVRSKSSPKDAHSMHATEGCFRRGSQWDSGWEPLPFFPQEAMPGELSKNFHFGPQSSDPEQFCMVTRAAALHSSIPGSP